MTSAIKRFALVVLAVASSVTAPSLAAGQGGTGTIRVQPNLATQPRDGFTVCAGTLQDRNQYGAKVTSSTGIVTFSGIPAGTRVVITVSKLTFTGAEAAWSVPAAGSTNEVVITVFSGSGGPLCTGAASPPAPPPLPAPSSAAITVDPDGDVRGGGFYVCVGTSSNRAQYGNAVTLAAAPTVNFTNIPSGSMVRATVVRAGYTSTERDWYPTPGQAVTLTIPISPGSGGPTCPAYTQPQARYLNPLPGLNAQMGEVRLQLPRPPEVRVLDQYSNPLAGVPVSFTVIQGGGVVNPGSVTTDADGMARATGWWLGPEPVANAVRASIAGGAATTTFTAKGMLVPVRIEAFTATTVTGTIGATTQHAPGVIARDRNGTGVPGVSVTFAPRANGGTVIPATAVTDATGVAKTTWRLGPVAGDQQLIASATNLGNVTYTAHALASSPVSTTLPPPPAATTSVPVPLAPAPARLGEETRAWHGERSQDLKTLDCRTFGTNYVMVAIEGNAGQGIDRMRVGCSMFRLDSLDNAIRWTEYFGDANGAARFERTCGDDEVIMAIGGTIHFEQMRSLTLRCRPIRFAGLTGGTINPEEKVGGSGVLGVQGGTAWPTESCTLNRPARAFTLSQNKFANSARDLGGAVVNTATGGGTISLAPWVLVGIQMVCEQPTM